MIGRYAAKVDVNQKEIVAALRKIGASVCLLHTVGNGTPDLLIGFRGQNILMEVKNEHGRLTPCQLKFIEAWRGDGVHIVKTPEDAINAIQRIELEDRRIK